MRNHDFRVPMMHFIVRSPSPLLFGANADDESDINPHWSVSVPVADRLGGQGTDLFTLACPMQERHPVLDNPARASFTVGHSSCLHTAITTRSEEHTAELQSH